MSVLLERSLGDAEGHGAHPLLARPGLCGIAGSEKLQLFAAGPARGRQDIPLELPHAGHAGDRLGEIVCACGTREPPERGLAEGDDALVANPMLQKPDQPCLVDPVKEASNVRVEYPVHLGGGDPDT